jgi:hypothetical protein
MNDVLHVKTPIYTSVDDIPVKMHCDSNPNPNPNCADRRLLPFFRRVGIVLPYLLTSTV